MKDNTKHILQRIALFVAVIILATAGLTLMYFAFGDTQQDTACKSIGYNVVAYVGSQTYCVNQTDSVKVAFKNCGFKTCEVYKIK